MRKSLNELIESTTDTKVENVNDKKLKLEYRTLRQRFLQLKEESDLRVSESKHMTEIAQKSVTKIR